MYVCIIPGTPGYNLKPLVRCPIKLPPDEIPRGIWTPVIAMYVCGLEKEGVRLANDAISREDALLGAGSSGELCATCMCAPC